MPNTSRDEIDPLVDDRRFAESMKTLREGKGWSQGEFAKRLKAAGLETFHQTTVSRVEKGERPVRIGEARIIAQALDTMVGVMIAPSQEGLVIQKLLQEVEEFREVQAAVHGAANSLLASKMTLMHQLKEAKEVDYEAWADTDLRNRIEVVMARAERALAGENWSAVVELGADEDDLHRLRLEANGIHPEA